MKSHERTPLLQRVTIAQREPRYSHQTIRRLCTITLTSCLVTAVSLLIFVPASFFPYFPWASPLPSGGWPQDTVLSALDLKELILSTPKEEKAREWSQYYTSGPHLAGKNFSQALWTKERWEDFGVIDTSIVSYDIYINYPVGHRLALLERQHSDTQPQTQDNAWKVKYEARLEEDVLEEDSTSGLEDRIPTFHGYSASGNVTASYVFVNYGTYKDFEDLLSANVSLKGKIALAKYGGIFRGLKVKRAQELGMVGAVLYGDPGDDGQVTEKNKVAAYPNGPARQPSSVQRGSVQFLSIAPGDPTTPGYPSKPDAPRLDPGNFIPHIPSIPISYVDALPLLRALNGHGPEAAVFNEYWQRGGLGYLGVNYNIGPSPENLVINLVNQQEYTTTPMWNVIGIINGTLPDEVVILGNHRDAWIAGGAGDPNSGSAALNEVVRTFGVALEKGWKPMRTIVFCSWDGEEAGLLGSTEWVEEYLPWLSKSAVAYLNVDVGTAGPNFGSAAAPLLNDAIYAITSMVQSPNQTIPGQTVRDTWSGQIQTMGSGSDFTAFQDFAGVPCLDMGFGPGPTDAIYHYHSNYDSFDWMDRFGDPGWHYHATIAKLWALLTAELAGRPVIHFRALDYAHALHTYLQKARPSMPSIYDTSQRGDGAFGIPAETFAAMTKAIAAFKVVAATLDARAAEITAALDQQIPWWKWWKKVQLYKAARKVNEKYMYLERQFLYSKGLDGREWFKHTIFAPGLWTGYSGATFPGLVESSADRNHTNAVRWGKILVGQLEMATALLK